MSTETMKFNQFLTDGTTAEVSGKTYAKAGTLREWAAYIRAGYIVNGTLTPIKSAARRYTLNNVAPEVGTGCARLRKEELEDGVTFTDEELLTYIDSHISYFRTLGRTN